MLKYLLFSFFEKTLSPQEVFEFSRNGTLGKMLAAGITEINENLQMKLVILNSIDTSLYYSQTQLPSYYFYMKTERPDWAITPEFRLLISTYYFKMKAHGFKSIPTSEIVLEADQVLSKIRLNGQKGRFYYGFKYDETPKQRFVIFLNSEAQTKIDQLFNFGLFDDKFINPDPSMNVTTLTQLKKEQLSFTEFKELKLLKKATQIFSSNSPFIRLRGGWANNELTPAQYKRAHLPVPIIAYCGEQSHTMLEFAKHLENDGYLTQFRVMDKVIKTSFTNNHAAVILQNKRTEKLYVLDSWLVSGRSEAKILPIKYWAIRAYNTHEIGNIPCDLLLSEDQRK